MPDKPRAILTPEFRLSFCSIYESGPDMNGVVRFSMEMLFPKERGGSQFREMMEIYNEALAGASFSGAGPTPRPFKEAIIDGDSKKQEGRHGMYMIKANSGKDYPPRLLMPNRAIAGPGDLYEGCWARAILSAYPYEARKDGKANAPVISRGAAFNILTVQKLRDDKPFTNSVTDAEQDELLIGSPVEGAEAELDSLLS